MLYDFLVDGFARLHELMANMVRLDDVSTKAGEHLAYHRFACGDAAGESYLEHGRLGLSKKHFHHRGHRGSQWPSPSPGLGT